MNESLNHVPQKKSPEEVEEALPEVEISAAEASIESQPPGFQRVMQEFEKKKAEQETARLEQGQLNNVRARLGLEKTNKVSSDSRQAEEIVHERPGSEKESQESHERDDRLREGSKQVEEAVTSFASAIQERAKNDMDPFMDSRAFSSIRANAGILTSFSEGRGAVNTEELAQALNSISKGLSQMEQQARGGPVRESDESLRRIGYATQMLSESAKKLGRNFKEGDELAAGAARRLSEQAEQIGIFMGRLRSALGNYNRR
jgi:hypothetical protein